MRPCKRGDDEDDGDDDDGDGGGGGDDDDDVTDKLVTESVNRQETLNFENLRVDGNIKLIINIKIDTP
jgi:hypothetical protein